MTKLPTRADMQAQIDKLTVENARLTTRLQGLIEGDNSRMSVELLSRRLEDYRKEAAMATGQIRDSVKELGSEHAETRKRVENAAPVVRQLQQQLGELK
jgi:hypothetical protein